MIRDDARVPELKNQLNVFIFINPFQVYFVMKFNSSNDEFSLVNIGIRDFSNLYQQEQFEPVRGLKEFL
jgi:hypothetical protein